MAYIDFQAQKKQMQHHRNQEARICHNCANLETKASTQRADGSAGHTQICGIGRFYVRSFETCESFQSKTEQ